MHAYVLYCAHSADRGSVAAPICGRSGADAIRYCTCNACVCQQRGTVRPVGGHHQAPVLLLLPPSPVPLSRQPFTFPPLHPHPHPDQHQHHIGQAHPDPASLHVHVRTGHPGQKGEGIVHHDDAGCLVFGAAVQGCMSKIKRQPAGSPDTLAERGRSVDRMPHEPGLCQTWEAARHSIRLPPGDEKRPRWALAICRDGRAGPHKVDHSTSYLRWYFGSSPPPSHRGGLEVGC